MPRADTDRGASGSNPPPGSVSKAHHRLRLTVLQRRQMALQQAKTTRVAALADTLYAHPAWSPAYKRVRGDIIENPHPDPHAASVPTKQKDSAKKPLIGLP